MGKWKKWRTWEQVQNWRDEAGGPIERVVMMGCYGNTWGAALMIGLQLYLCIWMRMSLKTAGRNEKFHIVILHHSSRLCAPALKDNDSRPSHWFSTPQKWSRTRYHRCDLEMSHVADSHRAHNISRSGIKKPHFGEVSPLQISLPLCTQFPAPFVLRLLEDAISCSSMLGCNYKAPFPHTLAFNYFLSDFTMQELVKASMKCGRLTTGRSGWTGYCSSCHSSTCYCLQLSPTHTRRFKALSSPLKCSCLHVCKITHTKREQGTYV